MGDLERARATYGKFIVVAPDSPLAPEVRVLIQDLDRSIAEAAAAERLPPALAGEGRAGAGATVDDRARRQPPMAPDMNAVAGVEEILPLGAAEVGGAPKTPLGADLTTASNERASRVDEETSERSGAPAASSSRHRWWLWGSIGGAVLVAATVAVVVLVASAPEATVVTDGSLGTLRR